MMSRVYRVSIRAVATFLVAGTLLSEATAGDKEYSSVVAWDILQMYERAANGKLMQRSFDPTKKEWTPWETLMDKEISSAPSALMTNGGTRLAVFFRGTDGKLQHVFRDKEAGWSPVISLGTREMQSAPSAIIVGDVLTVYARGTKGQLMQIFYDKAITSWTDWSDVD